MDNRAIEVRQGSADEILVAADILREHWDEVALNKELMVLAPDFSLYKTLEAAGRLIILCACAENELIGYAVSIIGPHPHYKELVVANNDVLFVRKEYRKGRTGLRLIKEMEAQAKHRGAKLVLWHAKAGTALEALLPRLGYGVQDIIFSARV